MSTINPNIYTVQFKDFHTGQLVKQKRSIPPKQHDMLPKDQVQLTQTRNEDWKEGKEATVNRLANRNPNVLQVEDNEGKKTFMYYHHLKTTKKGSGHGGSMDNPQQSGYLLWP